MDDTIYAVTSWYDGEKKTSSKRMRSSRLRHTAAPVEPVTPVTFPLRQCYTPEIAGQLGFVYGVTVNL
jgi:hypothetical protein